MKATSLSGDKSGRHFEVRFQRSEEKTGVCPTCKGPVRRSWLTGILHRRCFFCRHLVMIYGPTISVTRRIE